jgi:putative DNA primase/helicase
MSIDPVSAVLAAALAYAARGWAVFPCDPKTKSPLVKGSFKAATTDPTIIRAWWQRWPNAMIGLPTGGVIGAFVIDLDIGVVISGADYVERFTQYVGGNIPETAIAETASGGCHLYCKWDPARPVRNGAAVVPALTIPGPLGADGKRKKGAQVDVRGEGGYAIAPPSVRADGSAYRWIRAPQQGLAEATDRIWAVALKHEAKDAKVLPPPGTAGRVSESCAEDPGTKAQLKYARAALGRAQDKVARTPIGQRGHTLNAAAFGIAKFITVGVLSEDEVWAALRAGADRCGLTETDGRKERDAKIERGLAAGAQQGLTRLQETLDAVNRKAVARTSRGRPDHGGQPEAARESSSSSDHDAQEPGGEPVDRPSVRWPFAFKMVRDGLVFDPPGGDGPVWISAPFRILALARTEVHDGWSLQLEFEDPDGNTQSLPVARAALAADGAEVRRQLADLGLVISGARGARERLIEALAAVVCDRRVLIARCAGWQRELSVFALPHHTVAAAGAEEVVFEGRTGSSCFATAGSLQDWQKWVAVLADGHDRLAFSLGLAFTGPLLKPLGLEAGGFHFVGPSSSGKTTALRLAGSVWGGGGPLGFAQTWRTTANALEGIASAHNDVLLPLDEIGLIDPHDLESAAYTLAGGAGKNRMRADGGLRDGARWRIAILSSGEVGLAVRISEGGGSRRARPGQEVRIVELAADAGKGFGLFDHGGAAGDPSQLANMIREESDACYGHAGPAFVEHFVKHSDELTREARDIVKVAKSAWVPAGASGQVARVAERFALVAAAGEIAISVGVLPLAVNTVGCAARLLFDAWLAQRGGAGSGEIRDAVAQVRAFLQQHYAARFVGTEQAGKASWGPDRIAGYYNSDRELFFFTDAGWSEATLGLNPAAAADALAQRGFLLKDASGKRKRSERVGDRTMRVFVVKASIRDGNDDVR